MSNVLLPPIPHLPRPAPPPVSRRLRLKLKRIYLDITGSRVDREWRRAWSLGTSVDGWLYPEQERWLFDQAYALPDGAIILEIGSFKGRSTCFLASGCRGTRKKVFAVDTFNGNDRDFGYRDFLGEFVGNIKRGGLSRHVQPLVGVSWEVGEAWNKPIHLLFIDGSHEYEDVLRDFEAFFPHVVPGGIVAFHDVHESWPGPLRAWQDDVRHRLVDVGYCASLAHGRKPEAKP